MLLALSEMYLSPQYEQSPMKPFASVSDPKARLKPTSPQVIVDMLNMRKLKEIILSRFFLLTIPPKKKLTPGAISIIDVEAAMTHAKLPLSYATILNLIMN